MPLARPVLMRTHPISPSLPWSAPPHAGDAPPHAQAPPGFEAWFAQALNAGRLAHDPALAAGPADFGLWGVAPDSQGRLDLEEVAGNLHATLPAFASNLGNACRQAGLALPPRLRLEAGTDTQPALPFDAREAAVQQLFDAWPGLARQFRRLMAGFGFIRCSDALRAYQAAIGRLGPSRLAGALGQLGDAHSAPHLALVFDGHSAWPEEVSGEQWRTLASLAQLQRELQDCVPNAPYRVHERSVTLEQALDPGSLKLRSARQR